MVISNDLRNDYSESVLAIPISGEERGKFLPSHVFLPKGTGGLSKDSRALCEQVVSLDKIYFVEGPLGVIAPVTLTSMVRAINKAVEEL